MVTATFVPQIYEHFPEGVDGLDRNVKYVLNSAEVKQLFQVSKSTLERTWRPRSFNTPNRSRKKLFYLPHLIEDMDKFKTNVARKNQVDVLSKVTTQLDEIDITAEKTKLVVAQIAESKERERKLRIENDLKEEKTLDAESVALAVSKVYSEIKSKLEGFSSANSQALLACEDYGAIDRYLKDKMREILIDLVKDIKDG